jgi:predicted  nucleic acid-binding Zn-ribbon protein
MIPESVPDIEAYALVCQLESLVSQCATLNHQLKQVVEENKMLKSQLNQQSIIIQAQERETLLLSLQLTQRVKALKLETPAQQHRSEIDQLIQAIDHCLKLLHNYDAHSAENN